MVFGRLIQMALEAIPSVNAIPANIALIRIRFMKSLDAGPFNEVPAKLINAVWASGFELPS
jgi:hypothetical protein